MSGPHGPNTYATRQDPRAGERVVVPNFAASQEAFNAYAAQQMHSMQRPPAYGDPMRRSQSAVQSAGVPGPSQPDFSFGHPPPGWQGVPQAQERMVRVIYGNGMSAMVPARSLIPPSHVYGMMYPNPAQGGAAQASFGGGPPNNHAVQSDFDEPSVLPALGWWPDKLAPTLHWDLTSTQPPRYTKRPFSPEEFSKSPFSPPLERMRLVLDEECGWAFEILSPALVNSEMVKRRSSGGSDGVSVNRAGSGAGEKFITLQSFFNDLTALMHSQRVPVSFWRSATPAKRFRAARAMERRTGRSIPSSAIVLPSTMGNAENAELEAYVRSGALRPDMTTLRVSDLLGPEDVMFWGLALSRAPDEWVLRTASSRS